MSTEKKKEQQLLEELSAQPAARSSYSTAGLSSRREVENALANRMLHEEIHAGDAIRLTAAENQFVVLDCVGTHSNS